MNGIKNVTLYIDEGFLTGSCVSWQVSRENISDLDHVLPLCLGVDVSDLVAHCVLICSEIIIIIQHINEVSEGIAVDSFLLGHESWLTVLSLEYSEIGFSIAIIGSILKVEGLILGRHPEKWWLVVGLVSAVRKVNLVESIGAIQRIVQHRYTQKGNNCRWRSKTHLERFNIIYEIY